MKRMIIPSLILGLSSILTAGCGGEVISASRLADEPSDTPERLALPNELEVAVADAQATLNASGQYGLTELTIVEPAMVSFGSVGGGGFIHIDARVLAKYADGSTFLSLDFPLSGHNDKWPRESGWLTEAGLRELIIDEIKTDWQTNRGGQPEAALTPSRAHAWESALEAAQSSRERLYVTYLFAADQEITAAQTNGAHDVNLRVERLNLGEGTQAFSLTFTYMPNPPFESLATYELGATDLSFVARAPLAQLREAARTVVAEGVESLVKANPELAPSAK